MISWIQVRRLLPAAVLALAFLGAVSFSFAQPPAAAASDKPAKIDFNREIRPILSVNCFQCHGPDEATREAKLRLDLRAEAVRDRGGGQAIVPGDSAASEVYVRVTATDPRDVMPPPDSGHALTEEEIGLLKRWIEEGAHYAEHWAFAKPIRPEQPQVKQTSWPRNEIDFFVLKRLEEAGLAPSPSAGRHALIRRLSLDLTGLPPSPAEVEEFVNDPSEDAYEKLVDRLLQSSAYGERWARVWLDLARYADSAGYGSDPLRLNIWPYREWLIDALNRNLPYDQFTIEQIAGDLLPEPATEQLVATAFHRNTMTNTEGGTDPDEFHVAAVKDRVATTGQVWMGLTLDCAQCHTHKFDPISQREYFEFFAFFNQTEDHNRADERPTLPLPTAEEREQMESLGSQIAALESRIASPGDVFFAGLEEWVRRYNEDFDWEALRPVEVSSAAGAVLSPQADGSILVSGDVPDTDVYTVTAKTDLKEITAFRLEILPHESLPEAGPGRASDGAFVLTGFEAADLPESAEPLRARFVRIELPGRQRILSLAEVEVLRSGENLALQGAATQSSTDYDGPAHLAIDGNSDGHYFDARSTTHTRTENDPWWEVDLKAAVPIDEIVIWNRTDGRTGQRLNDFRVAALDDQRDVVWETKVERPPDPRLSLGVSGRQPIALVNGSATSSRAGFEIEEVFNADAQTGWSAAGAPGTEHAAVLQTAENAGSGSSKLVFTLSQEAGGQKTIGRFRILATTAARPVYVLPQDIETILAIAADERGEPQRNALIDYFRPHSSHLVSLRQEADGLKKKLNEIKPVAVPIMRELPEEKRRLTRILLQGNFLMPDEEVEPGVPEAFHPMPEGAPMNRLGLAQWLVSRDNPLTARVAVNRFWSRLFGVGIVETEEDFGTQGSLPAHPELLDWMAMEFMDNGWDMKGILKTMVMSATYQQSSRVRPELLEKDPVNRLVSRYPRRRLEAEMIRDQALALSGVLSRKIGGPSVFPPQPDGLWRAAFNSQRTWDTSQGEDRYRRGLYTFWRRTVPYPSMATFDAPSRENCTMRRIPTNTPLQALVTLNDPVFVELAQALARRLVLEGGDCVESRIRFGLKLCLARPPQDQQVNALASLFAQELEHYRANSEAAAKLAADPLGPLPEGMDVAELAAWTVVANVLLNLDGVLTNG